MTQPIIKFCGLTRPADVETALTLGAEFLGFIVECKSSRRLTIDQAAKLASPAKGLAQRVAVTVNASDELISNIVKDMQPDYIQLHGDESPAHLRKIKSTHTVGLIKAISISEPSDVENINSYAGHADFLLLDAKPPKGNEQRGGHGHSFDWSLLKAHKTTTPIIVAGGLSPETIGLAKKMTNAHIFDVSSGIEAAPGIKDATLMTKFMIAARQE